MTDNKISIEEYQKLAAVTMPKNPETDNDNIMILGLGIVGETGEVFELIKKHLGHGHDLDKDKLAKEIGDVLWYLFAICTATGHNVREVLMMRSFDFSENGSYINSYGNSEDFKNRSKLTRLTLTLETLAGDASCLLRFAIGVSGCGNAFYYHTHNLPNDCVIGFLFALSRLAKEFDLSLEKIAYDNIQKLKARYPDGFSHESSRNRIENQLVE